MSIPSRTATCSCAAIASSFLLPVRQSPSLVFSVFLRPVDDMTVFPLGNSSITVPSVASHANFLNLTVVWSNPCVWQRLPLLRGDYLCTRHSRSMHSRRDIARFTTHARQAQRQDHRGGFKSYHNLLLSQNPPPKKCTHPTLRNL